MKKILFFAAAAVAMSSCSENEVMVNPTSPANAISFGTYVGSATRATVETGFEADDVFVIDAYYTADKKMAASTPVAFMQKQTVTAAVTDPSLTWSYSPIKYWPNNTDEMVSFFAVTNATDASPITDFDALTGTTPSFTVTGANTDIMVASVLNNKKQDTAIEFKFQHTMAQVNFTATLADALAETTKTTVKVTSLTVNYGTSAANGGTFTFDNATPNSGGWSNGIGTRAEDVWDTDRAFGIGTALDNSATPTTIGEPIMVIPTTGASYVVTVVYDVATVDANNSANNSTITNTCTFNVAPEAMNTIYKYNLEIGLTEVKVIGTMAGWNSTKVDKTVTVESSTGSVA